MSTTAILHERTRELTSRYERHAYLVYNLALRITCAEAPAALAAERAFLTAADDEALIGAAARAALEEAPGRPPCDGAGDEQATALLRATAALPPVQRAALALTDLAEADAGEVASALALAPGIVEGILDRARADGPSDEERAGWLWAHPPDELWEHTYHRFHEETERDLSRPTVVMAAEPARAPRRRRRRWPLMLALLVAAGAGALYGTGVGLGGGGGGSASHPRGDQAAAASAPAAAAPAPPPPTGDQATTPVVAPNPKAGAPVKPAKPLTPKELDALRMRELAQVKRYAERQADDSLSARQRQAAAREVAHFQRIAQKRLEAAARREAKLRSELARERAARRREAAARRAAEREADAKAETHKPPPQPTPKPAAKSAPPPAQTTPQGDDASCLYNADDGTYICPDG